MPPKLGCPYHFLGDNHIFGYSICNIGTKSDRIDIGGIMKNYETGTGKGIGNGTGKGGKRETIRATNWASKLRLGANNDPLDDGICADLDQDSHPNRLKRHSPQNFGLERGEQSGMPSIGGEILAVVRTLMPSTRAP